MSNLAICLNWVMPAEENRLANLIAIVEAEAAEWLRSAAVEHFPNSSFAKLEPSPADPGRGETP